MNKYNIEELAEKLEHCRNVNFDDVKLEDVDEITDIKIDRRKSSNERILAFLIKTKNPYIFKVNGKLVRIRFSENSNLTADDLVMDLYKKTTLSNKILADCLVTLIWKDRIKISK